MAAGRPRPATRRATPATPKAKAERRTLATRMSARSSAARTLPRNAAGASGLRRRARRFRLKVVWNSTSSRQRGQSPTWLSNSTRSSTANSPSM